MRSGTLWKVPETCGASRQKLSAILLTLGIEPRISRSKTSALGHCAKRTALCKDAKRLAVKYYNFRQLENMLLPPYCRFRLWSSRQDDSFFEEAEAPKSVEDALEKNKAPEVVKKNTLWSTLTSGLALTYEQD
ncbi:hypothetical protein PsorP6_008018 [Peronosclerospora sorghi]|uniref:Uncharacterized protein n=1 Tax=Peronosclerospora sorghi TaxID=230839 RepID=A0ACC0W898_9STRA|nr:hypothetical protein PsorP6_008018 [Peronosclerospora sorghi]